MTPAGDGPNPSTGPGEWWWLGRGLAVDLMNTQLVADGSEDLVDLLPGPEALDGWLRHERAVLGEPLPRTSERLDDFRELRQAVRRLVEATIDGGQLPPVAVEVVNRATARAPITPELTIGPTGPAVAERLAAAHPADAVLARIARSAMDLISGDQRSRLRICPAAGCRVVFLASKSSQRWCNDVHGNRERVARSAARRRAGRIEGAS